jgi:transcriptional regulator with XRE-family HTH domain
MTTIGDRLRSIREYLGLTQTEAAARFGMGESSWKRLELEDRAPKGEVLAKLVEMHFSSDWLLTGIGEMRREDPAIDARLEELHRLLQPEPIPISSAHVAERADLRRIKEELEAMSSGQDILIKHRLAADQLLAIVFGDESAKFRVEGGGARVVDAYRPLPAERLRPDRLDRDLMKSAIVAVEEICLELGKSPSPEKKARLVLELYLHDVASRAQGKPGMSGAEIIRLVRAA